jgi:transposase
MMGHQPRHESLFYYFRLEDEIPSDHLLRLVDRFVDFGFVRERLRGAYSATGRPSIDPEVLVRLLLVGYLYGITSERRLMQEVRMHLAYRWFTRFDFDHPIPDHSTLSKNRHGRFRESGIFREVFEEIVRRCLAAGLIDGRHLIVDGTLVAADASARSRVTRTESAEPAPVSRTVEDYLTELERENPVEPSAAPAPTPAPAKPHTRSTTDPDAAWAVKRGPAAFAYFDHYLVDRDSRVIDGVDATPARFSQETEAARRMLDHVSDLGLHPESLSADKAYGSGDFLAWLLARGIRPYIAVMDRRHQRRGRFSRDDFRYEPAEDTYTCPEGQSLRYRGENCGTQGVIYSSLPSQCRLCPQKVRCTSGRYRKLFVHRQEAARETVRALVHTPAYERARRTRYRIEALFAELKQQMRLRRVRLRGLWNVAEQFHLAATAQNLKRLVRALAQQAAHCVASMA